MSAFIVSKRDIDYMVTAAVAAEIISPEYADQTGRMFWRENLKSLAYRYPDDRDGNRPGPIGFRDRMVETYTWTEMAVVPTGETLDEILGSYDYQTCEHPDYPQSEAYRLVQRMHG
jgi:hypothetical protein